ncbi:MAG: sensor histidine kinase, partial [Gemmatimonadota bacterium]
MALVNASVNYFLRPSQSSFAATVRNWFLAGLPASMVAYFGILAIGYLLFTTLELRERERDAARLEAQLSEAQVHALRMQLQPHFLFNALNAVMALIRDKANTEAVHALSQLSDLLRGALRDPSHEVTLAQEMDFIERYLDIERLRLGDRLQVVVDVPPALGSALVPTFVLQPLVENAIKHGVSQSRGGGAVRVSARAEGESLVLAVANDGPAVSAVTTGSGVGVANTRGRLERMYGARGTLTLATGVGKASITFNASIVTHDTSRLLTLDAGGTISI